jgi:hypothetical protein
LLCHRNCSPSLTNGATRGLTYLQILKAEGAGSIQLE